MKSSKDYHIEDFVQSSEELLSGLENIDEFTGTLPPIVENKIQEEIEQERLESLEHSYGLKADGFVTLNIAPDAMICWADFYPPSVGGKVISPDEVGQLLSGKGINYGVDWEVIKQSILECNTEGNELTDVVIARGTKAEDEVPEHLVINQRLRAEEPAQEAGQERIDYREISAFTLVKAGEVLAEVVPKTPGQMGSTIRGEAIAYRTAAIPVQKPGRNTHREEGRVLAACEGTFEYNPTSFWVNKVLKVAGNVDYRTGNIRFPGDVFIDGEVKDGFKIESGGSIYCEKTLDASEVHCEKDLIVKLGVIGKNKGVVKAKGRIEVKFMENCYVEARGPIVVQVGILNSVVHSLNRVTTGKRGLIVGGKVYALKGVTTNQIGSRMGPKTEIYCGIDYSVLQKIEWIRDKNIELVFKLQEVEKRLKAAKNENEKLSALREKLKGAISKLNEAAKGLIVHLDKEEKAQVVVRDTAFPGAYIEICHVPYIVSHRMECVRFVLDKAKGRIQVESL